MSVSNDNHAKVVADFQIDRSPPKHRPSRQNRLGNQYIESVMEKRQIEACELPKICFISSLSIEFGFD